MTGQTGKIRVGLNGYGVIGKRVADAVACQDDMELVGIADIATDWRLRTAAQKGFKLFASQEEGVGTRKADSDVLRRPARSALGRREHHHRLHAEPDRNEERRALVSSSMCSAARNTR